MHQPLIGKIATAVGLIAGLALNNAQLDSTHPYVPTAEDKAFHYVSDAERKRKAKARKAQKAAKKARRRNRGR